MILYCLRSSNSCAQDSNCLGRLHHLAQAQAPTCKTAKSRRGVPKRQSTGLTHPNSVQSDRLLAIVSYLLAWSIAAICRRPLRVCDRPIQRRRKRCLCGRSRRIAHLIPRALGHSALDRETREKSARGRLGWIVVAFFVPDNELGKRRFGCPLGNRDCD